MLVVGARGSVVKLMERILCSCFLLQAVFVSPLSLAGICWACEIPFCDNSIVLSQ